MTEHEVQPAPPASLEEALSWRGAKLEDLGGAGVGRVEGVLVDSESGEPSWLLVRMGRIGHFSAVPFDHAAAAPERVWVPFERGRIRAAPRVEPGEPLSRELELELCAHFELAEAGGRAAELRARPDGSATSRRAASA